MRFAVTAFLSAMASFGNAHACSRSMPISVPWLIDNADLIVRAFPVGYLVEPGPVWSTGRAESIVIFRIQEVLKGNAVADTLCLNGYLPDRDDFTDHPAPYRFVRPGGRAGSCFANTYRESAQFLLLLTREPDGYYTVEWDALSPVNEQLHSDEDPWLLWVKGFLAGRKPPEPSLSAPRPEH